MADPATLATWEEGELRPGLRFVRSLLKYTHEPNGDGDIPYLNPALLIAGLMRLAPAGQWGNSVTTWQSSHVTGSPEIGFHSLKIHSKH
jgi:hypothetical protein